jgi:choline transport protein
MENLEQGTVTMNSNVHKKSSIDIYQVSDRTSIPVYAVAFTSFIACLLALVNIGSIAAFNGVISVAIAGLFSSYLLTSSLLLYRRCTGAILPPSEAFDTDAISITSDGMVRAVWGPWRLPGAIGIANNIFACAYLSFVFFFSFWPTFAEVTPANMNWAILVTGAIAIISAVYYAVWARKTYHGPVVEIDALALSGRVSVVEQRHEMGSK